MKQTSPKGCNKKKERNLPDAPKAFPVLHLHHFEQEVLKLKRVCDLVALGQHTGDHVEGGIELCS